ncbi:MAG: type I DNA topoisomerase [Dehalococcoidales bacterium]|nr:type I DNA topoisomerase [Dehalococcoidales bacterium]
MKNNLVIVESPAKAKTLAKILGKGYTIKASLGHIRDLPKSRLGVDTDNNFEPKYVVARDKNKTVKELKDAARTASTVYLATDPDREGEAIAWHLVEAIKLNDIKYRRVTFHEITQEAITHAFKSTREIDMQLVNAQQTRRILDRLVGYKLSPLLWSKVRKGLSAGRVQSVAVKIIVDREREIENFVPVEYWTIEAELRKDPAGDSEAFRALLVKTADNNKSEIKNRDEATAIKAELEKAAYSVSKVGVKKTPRQPAPPFITSTLQQEAWRRFHFTAKMTMATAQQLYEGLPVGNEGNVGLITYMRTDSTHVAPSALAEVRNYISEKYGAEYLPAHARSFFHKVKGAQEAHEAIRPTKAWRTPASIKQCLNPTQYKIYNLIWQRMVASQMAEASFENTTVDIDAKCTLSKNKYLFRATSSINIFPGFMILYSEEKDDEEEKKFSALPQMVKGDNLKLLSLFDEQHFTRPPSRYTEATLIKMLEQWGIGRPSTYAPILSTIQEREYVTKPGGSFKPTELGIIVNDLLFQHFSNIVNIDFTAQLENDLDKIANEGMDWIQVVKELYEPFNDDLQKATEAIEKVKLADEETGELCPLCAKPVVIKVGRFGKFMACSGYPECKYTSSFKIKTGAKCPDCGADIIEKRSKKKRKFYGCSSFPKCNFAINTKPLPQPCPKCGGLVTEYRIKWGKCTKCDYKNKLQQD